MAACTGIQPYGGSVVREEKRSGKAIKYYAAIVKNVGGG